MAPVTSVPSRYYLCTHLHISFSPLQCILELPVSHPTPSSNLTTLPLQPHLSKGTNPESFFWLGVTVHLYSYHFTPDQPLGIAWQPICHLIGWIARKTRMLQLLLQRVTSITGTIFFQPNYRFHSKPHHY